MKVKLIVFAILLLGTLLAFAIVQPNLDGRRAILNERAAPLVLECIYIAQKEYYNEHKKYAEKLSELKIPPRINDKLRALGNEYVINERSLRLMEYGEFVGFFKYIYWISTDHQKVFILMIPDKINRGFNCWMFLDHQKKEGLLVINGGPEQMDISSILFDPQKFANTSEYRAHYYKKLPLDNSEIY